MKTEKGNRLTAVGKIAIAQSNRRRAVLAAERYRELGRTCAHCGGPLKREQPKFCSRLCMGLSRSLSQHGERNPRWMGSDASYQAFHGRVRKVRGTPHHCERCGAREPGLRYEWANLTGKYDDPFDYERMCKKCHNKFDNIGRHLKGTRKFDLYRKDEREAKAVTP